MKDEEKVAPRGPVCRMVGFLQILEEMEEKGETKRLIFGTFGNPFFTRAAYGCLIRLGIEPDDSH